MSTITVYIRNLVVLGAVILTASAVTMAQKKVSTLEAEKRLAELGYWVAKVDGVADASTRHAVMAFQKVEGLKRTGVLTAAVFEKMKEATVPTAKYDGGAHVEVDISRQVLFVVDDTGQVGLIVPVSTGNGEKYYDKTTGKWEVASTPRGTFKFYNKINGTRVAPLGQLYYPSYFKGGWAVHGSNSIPPKPASHGCVRVPRGADAKLFKLMPRGMEIHLYD
jgi:peptidoglycan hydrolase-like protein with peptidoglycan-binding domain